MTGARARTIEVALEVLPFPREARLRAVDLGTGTAFLAQRFLERFPESTVVDGASTMLDLARAGGLDQRFVDPVSTRAWLDEMESREGDQPLTLARDLAVAREAGLHVDVFWKEHREAVWGGPAWEARA